MLITESTATIGNISVFESNVFFSTGFTSTVGFSTTFSISIIFAILNPTTTVMYFNIFYHMLGLGIKILIKRYMKKSTIYFLLILLVLGGLTAYIISKNKGKEDKGKTPEAIEKQEDDAERGDDKEVTVEDKKDKTNGEPAKGDFSGFSSNTQEVGSLVEDDKFTLESISDTRRDGYHEFVFELKGISEPQAVARYDANANVIKISISNVQKDSAGIPFQGERIVNKEGILRLYHNVSGSEEKSFYDIGLSQSTVFKLDLVSKSSSQNTWSVVLNVKYPGAKEISGNLGSSEFSLSDQSISGVGSDKDSSINSYAYSASGGILKFAFVVSASGENPIPMASAKYNEDGDLVLTFESLKIDRAVKSLNGASLPLGMTLSTIREGEKSVYTFSGMEEREEFKLSAILSPNQVVIEIK